MLNLWGRKGLERNSNSDFFWWLVSWWKLNSELSCGARFFKRITEICWNNGANLVVSPQVHFRRASLTIIQVTRTGTQTHFSTLLQMHHSSQASIWERTSSAEKRKTEREKMENGELLAGLQSHQPFFHQRACRPAELHYRPVAERSFSCYESETMTQG